MAYAKLVAENGKEFYVNELDLEIGRESKLQCGKYFCLAESNTISKNHAKIFWDKASNSFMIQNLSKNKVRSIYDNECIFIDIRQFQRSHKQ